MYYYSQFVGDANNLPVLKATPDFYGIGILDSDPYVIYQVQWYENQNNFWRHVRNFVFDMTDVPATQSVHGIHWQVAQGASLQNLVFNMAEGTTGDGNQHVGVFMDNGSSEFFEDLIFNGGQYGFFTGNQQLNIRNLTFNRCETGIYQNWGWIFSYKSLTFNQCGIGIDMSQGDDLPVVHSIVVQDSDFNDCDFGIISTFSSNSTPTAAGTLVLDNVNFANTNPAISYPNNTVIVPGNQDHVSYLSGTRYTVYDARAQSGNLACFGPTTNHSRSMGTITPPTKPANLVDANGRFYERSRPQYEGVPVGNFVSILAYGCPNDGVLDSTACVQSYFNSITADQVAFVDHGAYVITDTITVPNNIKVIGEVWPLFMVTGSKFQDQYNPLPAFRVGQPGDIGTTEITEIIFETIGPVPGAIMMEWNLACTAPTLCGIWDSHWRIGGSNGTELQSTNCAKNPNMLHGAPSACWAAFLLVHLTSTASNVILSHNWLWVADHELDLDGKDQLDIYNGRGILIESQGPLWIYGSSSEHSQLYNYQIANAKDIYIGLAQSETAYMQGNPNALASFQPQTRYNDPTFEECFLPRCYKTIAMRIFNSFNVFNYGSGFYSFFENYDSACISTASCDERNFKIDKSEGIYFYGRNSIAATYMVQVDGVDLCPASDNKGTFAETIALLEYP